MLAAGIPCLYRGAFYGPVAAKDTTISWLWFQLLMTRYTRVEIQTGICRHDFLLLMSAKRTLDRRLHDNWVMCHIQQIYTLLSGR